MKIWSKTLTRGDLFDAAVRVNAEFPGCTVGVASECEVYEGPRTRRIDSVHLRSTNGRRPANSGTHGAVDGWGNMAASWTEWGWFLARVFERDPDARCGGYKGMDDFHAQTDGLFIDPRSPRERQIKRTLKSA